MMSKYDFKIDLSSHNSLSLIIKQIKKGSKVLEFGCANGRLTKYLKEELDCCVTIVEYDEESGNQAAVYAEKSIVGATLGNIELFNWVKELGSEKYDYIVFADVLEHLHNPKEVLSTCKSFLVKDGNFLVTVPNLANNSVIAYLCTERFDYSDTGLLDNTHVHFFSLESFRNLVNEIGCEMVYENATYSKMGFDEIPIEFNSVDSLLRKYLNERPLGSVYQFFFSFTNYEATNSREHETVFAPNNSGYYYSELFLGNKKNEFDTNHVIRKNVYKGENVFTKNIEFFRGESVRFDFVNAPCLVQLTSIKVNGIDVNKSGLIHNANYNEDDIYLFLHSDSNIYFKFDSILEKVKIEVRFQLLDYDMGMEYYDEFIRKIISKEADIKNENEKRIREYQATVVNYQTTIDEYQATVVNCQTTINEYQTTVANCQTTIDEYEETVINCQTTIDEYKASIDEKETIIENLIEQKDENIESINNMSLHIQNLEAIIKNQNEVIVKTEEELERIKKLRVYKYFIKN